MPGPTRDQRASIAARISLSDIPSRSIAVASRVMETQVPQPKPWVSSTTQPSARFSLT